jgi:hypothetical protein
MSRASSCSLLTGLSVDTDQALPDEASDTAILALPFQMRRSGVEARLILNVASASGRKADPSLVQLSVTPIAG